MASLHDLELAGAVAWHRSHPKAVAHYHGEWVAIGPVGVLARGEDLKNVLAESEMQGCEQPLLYKVPPKGILALWWMCDALQK